MKVIAGELKTSFKNIFSPREYVRTTDVKEKEYMEQVEIRRQKTNLKRSMVVAVFFLVVLSISAVIFIVDGDMDMQTTVFMIWSALMCVLYVEVAEKQYEKLPEKICSFLEFMGNLSTLSKGIRRVCFIWLFGFSIA